MNFLSFCPRRLHSTLSKWSLDGIPRPKPILPSNNTKLDLSEDNDIVNGTRPGTPPLHERTPPSSPTPHEYKTHRSTLQKHFPSGWSPPKKISRQAMEGLRQLNRFDPKKFSTPFLADKFRISPEAVRRILKSKWEPPREKRIRLVEREREARWERIRASELKERMEMKEIAEYKRVVESSQGRDKTGRFVAKDRLTLT